MGFEWGSRDTSPDILEWFSQADPLLRICSSKFKVQSLSANCAALATASPKSSKLRGLDLCTQTLDSWKPAIYLDSSQTREVGSGRFGRAHRVVGRQGVRGEVTLGRAAQGC